MKPVWSHSFGRVEIFQEFLNALCGDIQFGNRGILSYWVCFLWGVFKGLSLVNTKLN